MLFLSLWGLQEFNADFDLENITYPYDTPPQWQITESTSQEQQLFSELIDQPFYWIDHGHQVHVFESSDGNYVLKIFKFKRLKPSWMKSVLAALPLCADYCAKEEQKRQLRLNKLFSGYHYAYLLDKEATGISYLQLDPQQTLFPHRVIHCIDRLGRSHDIPLNEIRFALQKKAMRTKELLVQLLDRGDVMSVKQRIRQLFEMFFKEHQQGVGDRDHNILLNTGFVDDTPLRLDVGQLYSLEGTPKEESFDLLKQDLRKIGDKRIYQWLRKTYPRYAEEIRDQMDNDLNALLEKG